MASDFANRRCESVVFSRDHRVLRRSLSGNAFQCAKPEKKTIHRPLDGIRRPSASLVVSRVSLSKWICNQYRAMLHDFGERAIQASTLIPLSPRSVLRLSLVGAIVFGIVSTTMVYRYLGERALAREESANEVAITPLAETIPVTPSVLGESDQNDDRFVSEVVDDLEGMQKIKEKAALETKIREMVAGYPIESMVPYIMEKDKIVAAFLVGIAKKESAWGKHVPLMNEHDCFNYWGYRGKRRLMGTGGHTCFNSPKDAVDTVSRRLEKLINTEKVDTPAEMMVVWKCGYDCSAQSSVDTKKWIQDVDLYFHRLDEES